MKQSFYTLTLMIAAMILWSPVNAEQEVIEQKPIDPEMFFSESAPEIVHKPSKPFVLNGEWYAAEEITKFNGRPLFFVLDENAEAEGVMYVYKNMADLQEYFKSKESKGASFSPAAASYSEFFNYRNYLGPSVKVNIGNYINLAGTQFDNNIESVIVATDGGRTVLADCANLNLECGKGAAFLHNLQSFPDLSEYDWDNVASSVGVCNPGVEMCTAQ